MTAFFGSVLGRYLIGGGLILIGWFAFLKSHDSNVIAKHELKKERKIASHAKNANSIRGAAAALPADRMFDKYTRPD